MTAFVSDIVTLLDRMAPPRLAEDWDNVGLQVGDPRQPVQSVWIALDPSLDFVQAACQENIDLLITHHPLIFRGASTEVLPGQEYRFIGAVAGEPVKVIKEEVNWLKCGQLV